MTYKELANNHYVSILDTQNVCGVYFLIYKEDVVYVGQSHNIRKRLKGHSNKNYDYVGFQVCLEKDLLQTEDYFIKILNPKYNKMYNNKKRINHSEVNKHITFRILNEMPVGTKFTGSDLERYVCREAIKKPQITTVLRYMRLYRNLNRKIICLEKRKSLYEMIEYKRGYHEK